MSIKRDPVVGYSKMLPMGHIKNCHEHVNVHRLSPSFIHDRHYDQRPQTSVFYYNTTGKTVRVIDFGGIERTIKDNTQDFNRMYAHNPEMEMYTNHFIIIYREAFDGVHVEVSASSCTDSISRQRNIDEYNRGSEFIATAICGTELSHWHSGYPVDALGITVGYYGNHHCPVNKMAMAFLREKGSALGAGIRVCANVRKSSIGEMNLVIGGHLFTVYPSGEYSDESPDTITVYKTATDGKDIEIACYNIHDVISNKINDIKFFANEYDAKTYIRRLNESISSTEELHKLLTEAKAKVKDLESKNQDLLHKLNISEKKLENEKVTSGKETTKAKTGVWAAAVNLFKAVIDAGMSALRFFGLFKN